MNPEHGGQLYNVAEETIGAKMTRRNILMAAIAALPLASCAGNARHPIGWRIGRISQWIDLGHGWCGRCLTTWGFVRGHSTMLTQSTGAFPLCEACWSDLTPQERLPYYATLRARWMTDAMAGGYESQIEPWDIWERAVLTEDDAKATGTAGERP